MIPVQHHSPSFIIHLKTRKCSTRVFHTILSQKQSTKQEAGSTHCMFLAHYCLKSQLIKALSVQVILLMNLEKRCRRARAMSSIHGNFSTMLEWMPADYHSVLMTREIKNALGLIY